MIFHREAQPGWEDRISKLSDHLKTMFLMLPHEPRTFALLMSLAGLTNGFLEQHKYHISKRMPKPNDRLEDDALADALIARYDGLLGTDISHATMPPKTDMEIIQPEPITEERMAQIACAIQNRPDTTQVHTILFLAKMKGAKVSFKFGEFPTCPYSPGIRQHIDEGLRLGLFAGFGKVRIKDRGIRQKIPPKLNASIVAMKSRQAAINGEPLTANVLFHLDRGEWGPKLFYGIMEKRRTMLSHWHKMRELVLNILHHGHVDMSIFPAGLPERLIVPKEGKGMQQRQANQELLKRWWLEVHLATIKAFRFSQDISENGLWPLWPQV